MDKIVANFNSKFNTQIIYLGFGTDGHHNFRIGYWEAASPEHMAFLREYFRLVIQDDWDDEDCGRQYCQQCFGFHQISNQSDKPTWFERFKIGVKQLWKIKSNSRPTT